MDRKPIFDAVRAMLGRGFSAAEVEALDYAITQAVGEFSAAPAVSPAQAMKIKHLRREEGVIPYAYQDHLSYWTIGVGRLIDKRKGGRLTDAEIDMLLLNDIQEKEADLEKHAGLKAAWARVKNDPVRSTALLSMCFQMGAEGLAGFKNSLALVAVGKFKEAAANMLQSAWAKQTPERAKRVTTMIATGVYQA